MGAIQGGRREWGYAPVQSKKTPPDQESVWNVPSRDKFTHKIESKLFIDTHIVPHLFIISRCPISFDGRV